MKKICISLALAIATIGIAEAQEGVPAEEQILTPQKETTTQQKEGRKRITETDLPQLVQEALQQGEFQGMSITEAYELAGEALDEIPTTTQDPKPELLYELQVVDAATGSMAIVYFTQEGILYEVVRKA